MRLFSLSILAANAWPSMLGRLVSTILAVCIGASAWAQPVSGLIVKLKPGAVLEAGSFETPQAASNARANHERERARSVASDAGVVLRQHAHVGAGHHLLSLPAPQQGAALEATIRRLRLHPEVLHVEADERQRIQTTTPNDPSFVLQTHLGAPSRYASGVNLPLAWDRTTGTAVVVAVLDTGVRLNHPDLVGKLLPGYDFVSEVSFANDGDGRDSDPSDPGDWVTAAEANTAQFTSCDVVNSSWHGTFIAGQIAAATNNGAGVAGINWNAKILPVRVSGKCGAMLSDILDAMRWAAGLSVAGVPNNPNPARIINLSFGGSQPCSAAYQDVINEVTEAGALVVVAAGNGFGAGDTMQLKRPADCQRVLAVGAVLSNGEKTSYSYVGANMGLMAPGGVTGNTSAASGLFSTLNTGVTTSQIDGYGYKAGTSFSAPLAAGVASLMLAINPVLTPALLITRLKSSARPHIFNALLPSCADTPNKACNCSTVMCGAGLLDAEQALQMALLPAAVIGQVLSNSNTVGTGAVVGTTSASDTSLKLPTASVGSVSTGVVIGTTLTLDATRSSAAGTATLISYAWDFVGAKNGAGVQNASAAQTILSLPQVGVVNLRLKVIDSAGAVGEDTVRITVAQPVIIQNLTTIPTTQSGSGGGSTGVWWALGLWALVIGLLWRGRPTKRATVA
jgi:serine protease